MDRIDLFRVFTRVVECASFTRAAASLGLPRSSVSAAIQELEGRIGARLLHRTTRKVAPTQDGATLYERCLRLIADVEETESLFRRTAAGPAGRIKLDVPGRIGRLLVAPALQTTMQKLLRGLDGSNVARSAVPIDLDGIGEQAAEASSGRR